jgi:hypothetical protein
MSLTFSKKNIGILKEISLLYSINKKWECVESMSLPLPFSNAEMDYLDSKIIDGLLKSVHALPRGVKDSDFRHECMDGHLEVEQWLVNFNHRQKHSEFL